MLLAQNEPTYRRNGRSLQWMSDLFELGKETFIIITDNTSHEGRILPSGIPVQLITDNGSQYKSREFQKFVAHCDFQLTTSSPTYASFTLQRPWRTPHHRRNSNNKPKKKNQHLTQNLNVIQIMTVGTRIYDCRWGTPLESTVTPNVIFDSIRLKGVGPSLQSGRWWGMDYTWHEKMTLYRHHHHRLSSSTMAVTRNCCRKLPAFGHTLQPKAS